MKQIPVALLTDLAEDATTWCFLLRVLTKSGTLIGFTSLDADVTYDPATVDPEGTGDNWGSAVHHADNGAVLSRMQGTADMSVDNAELQGWVADAGITEAQIRAGLFDNAKVRIYRVNYMDLSHGHELVRSGRLGEAKFSANSWIAEFRSLKQQMKQPISKVYSTTCPARFGSKAIGTGGGVFEERHPCGKDFTWTNGTVTSLGAETDRIFTDSALTEADDYFNMGVVEWLTGNNAGKEVEVDLHASDTLSLALHTDYPIVVGDTYRVRKDCSKEYDDAANGCLFHYGITDRNLNFRGQPKIPVSDGGANQVPGAQISRA